MGNYFNELRLKIIRANNSSKWVIFFNLYTKSSEKSGSESPWRKRDFSPTWNLEIKS